MKINSIIFLIALIFINMACAGKIASQELVPVLCNSEQYKERTKEFKELSTVPKIDFRVFPQDDPQKMQALKESTTLNVSETCLVEYVSGSPEEFVFSPHIVDCVGLVVSQNTSAEKRIFISHIARETKEQILEQFNQHNFSLTESTVLMMTSLQSDILLFVYNALKDKGFKNIFTHYGPIVRDANTIYIPVGLFNGMQLNAETIRKEVRKWTTSTMIVSTAIGDLFIFDPKEDWRDSERVLALKSSS